MAWYAASIVTYVKFKDGRQSTYPVYENVVLIEAGSPPEALTKAELIGRAEEGDADGSMHWEDRPAEIVFAGVRKILECQNHEDRPGDSTEISYSEFELDDHESLAKLVRGEPVKLSYEE